MSPSWASHGACNSLYCTDRVENSHICDLASVGSCGIYDILYQYCET